MCVCVLECYGAVYADADYNKALVRPLAHLSNYQTVRHTIRCIVEHHWYRIYQYKCYARM